eukprot:scaffold6494_cov129-Isochrysis_galbana.AAC.5
MSYSRRTFVFIAPASGSAPPRSCTSSDRAACSSDSSPPSAVRDTCMKRLINLIVSSRIDFSFRARSSVDRSP